MPASRARERMRTVGIVVGRSEEAYCVMALELGSIGSVTRPVAKRRVEHRA
jgi:hypothetical protein